MIKRIPICDLTHIVKQAESIHKICLRFSDVTCTSNWCVIKMLWQIMTSVMKNIWTRDFCDPGVIPVWYRCDTGAVLDHWTELTGLPRAGNYVWFVIKIEATWTNCTPEEPGTDFANPRVHSDASISEVVQWKHMSLFPSIDSFQSTIKRNAVVLR